MSSVDTALEAVIEAARAHRRVLADDASSQEEIWSAFVALNNASVRYDDAIAQWYDEVTPWDCELIEAEDAVSLHEGEPERVQVPPRTAPGESVRISVRQRRDFSILDEEAVLEQARRARPEEGQFTHLGQAVYALMDAGDGTLAALDDLEELEPENGVVLINEVAPTMSSGRGEKPLEERSPEEVFTLSRNDTLLYRLDETILPEA